MQACLVDFRRFVFGAANLIGVADSCGKSTRISLIGLIMSDPDKTRLEALFEISSQACERSHHLKGQVLNVRKEQLYGLLLSAVDMPGLFF